jgi:polygalacturonase
MKNYKSITVRFLLICILLSGFKAKIYSDDNKHNIPFEFPDIQPPVFAEKIFDIRKYGAVAGGEQLNTDVIRQAITECNLSGGGKVVVPSGVWLTGAIHLKNNVNLHLEEGAELRFSKDYDDYLPIVLIQRGGWFCYNYSPFIYANQCENIAVTGTGTLNGQGSVWWPWTKNQPGMTQLREMAEAGTPIEERRFGKKEDGVRPPFIQFIDCENVYLQGVTVVDGPSWNIHPVACTNVIIRGIKISAQGPNNDGIDPDACKNVLIEDCYIDVGDDNICLKSGRIEETMKKTGACENIVVRNCRTGRGHGGFVIGSEMSGDVRNVFVENCIFSGTDKGLRFKTQRGRGGVVENIYINNIRMENIAREAIFFDTYYWVKPLKEGESEIIPEISAGTPEFRNFQIKNIICNGARTAIFIRGLPEMPVNGVSIENVTIEAGKGIEIINARNISLNHLKLDIKSADPLIYIKNSSYIGINIRDYVNTADMFLTLDGDKCSDIEIKNIKSEDLRNKINYQNQATKDAVKWNE